MTLSNDQKEELIQVLRDRFNKNMIRHPNLEWSQVAGRIDQDENKMWSLYEMERTGGEPDVVLQDENTGEVVFYDCSTESPKGRRSVCYDRQGWESRKEHRPKNNAIDMAKGMGIELLSVDEYHHLQSTGRFDAKTSSWLKTPDEIRKLGGALFGDFRYNTVFVYHNGAQSYYAARGFRGSLKV
jgi:hypothetical protein